jgi:hypothetical protein
LDEIYINLRLISFFANEEIISRKMERAMEMEKEKKKQEIESDKEKSKV